MKHLLYRAGRTMAAITITIKHQLALTAAVVAAVYTSAGAQPADLVLTHGKIFTADSSRRYVEAVAIRGNRVIATGSNAMVEKLAGKNTRHLHLKGATVVPGFNDAHDHPGYQGAIGLYYTYPGFDMVGPSPASVLDSVARLVASAKPGQWISGPLGLKVLAYPRMRAALDSLAPNNPVILQAMWGHGTVPNTRALAAAGIAENAADPQGGWYTRTPDHKIAVAQETAQLPLWIAFTKANLAAYIPALRVFSHEQLQRGITSVQYMNTALSQADVMPAFGKAALQQHIRIIKWPLGTPAARDMRGMKNSVAGPWLECSGVKYLVDGTPVEGNALAKHGHGTPANPGRLNYPRNVIGQILSEALTGNDQLLLHIAGDSTLGVVLGLMKQLAPPAQWQAKRVRIEHNSTAYITPEETEAIVNMKILMMHTPKFAHTSPLKSLMNKGVMIGIAPDGTTNPFFDILNITASMANPSENVSREEAVMMYTYVNAFAELKEHEKGSIKPGMVADLAVLSHDMFTVPDDQLMAIRSVLTIVNGQVVYEEAPPATGSR